MSWICENHPQITSSGSKVVVTDGEYFNQCAPLNAYWMPKSGGLSKPGSYYFQFTFKETKDSGWVGLTTKDHFGPGYGLKGLMYGGNLADGSGLLVGNFGERISAGDVVGIQVKLTEEDLKVYLIHNDKPLGLAFDIKKPYPTPLLPCIHLYGPGEVEISEPDVQPTDLERKKVTNEGLDGPWKLVEVEEKQVVKEESRKWRCSLNIQLEGSRRFGRSSSPDLEKKAYHVQFRVGNSMSYTLEKVDNGWVLSGGCMTRMGVFGEDADAERYLSTFCGQFAHLEQKGDELVLIGKDGQKMKFKRAEEHVPSPVTKNVFASD